MRKESEIKKVGIVCAYQFPEGMAPTIRILAYSKGLRQNGVDVEIFTFKETPAGEDIPMEGYVNGILYKRSYIKRRKGLFVGLCDRLNMFRRLYQQIKTSDKVSPFDYILLSFDSLDKLYTIVPLLKLLNKRLLFIGDEFPEPIRRLKKDIPWWQKPAYRFIHRFLDGRILMTRNLQKFYDKRAGEKPTFILNSIIDEKRFESVSRQPVEQKYICYMGNMQLAKDNVDNIIRAFSIISSSYPDYHLWLFGTPSEKDRKIIEDVIAETDMQDKVLIKGRIDYDQVPQVLANASILVTSQPVTTRAEGGFPTKMAEYMMSGTPMIVTDVGEICNYVTDGENAFVVEPCNPEAYANKIRYIFSSSEIAEKVAQRANIDAMTNFSSKITLKQLIEFLNCK